MTLLSVVPNVNKEKHLIPTSPYLDPRRNLYIKDIHKIYLLKMFIKKENKLHYHEEKLNIVTKTFIFLFFYKFFTENK